MRGERDDGPPPAGLAWYLPDRARRRQIFHIALPMIGGMASQNVLNLVDTAMVGTLGDVALAAAGLGSFANFLGIAVILGISTGVQAMASRRLGEGRANETAIPLNGGLLLALLVGVPLSFLLVAGSDRIFALLNDDPAVVAAGGPYLEVRMAAMVGVGMNFAFRGYWSAVRLTHLYMGTLVAMHLLNVVLNWVLIFGKLGAPALGVLGAAYATTISIYCGTAIYVVLAFLHSRPAGFLARVPSRRTLATIGRIALPSSFQQLFFAAGMVALFWIVGQIGTAELAVVHVLITLSLVAILPAMGLGIAAASLVGHALGRDGTPEDASRWGWNVAVVAALVGVFIGVPAALFHEPILALFLTEEATRELARAPLILAGCLIWFDAAGMTLFNAHLGAGASKRVMIITLASQWLLFLPLAWVLGPGLGAGLLAVWALQLGYRTLQAALFIQSWRSGRWAGVAV